MKSVSLVLLAMSLSTPALRAEEPFLATEAVVVESVELTGKMPLQNAATKEGHDQAIAQVIVRAKVLSWGCTKAGDFELKFTGVKDGNQTVNIIRNLYDTCAKTPRTLSITLSAPAPSTSNEFRIGNPVLVEDHREFEGDDGL